MTMPRLAQFRPWTWAQTSSPEDWDMEIDDQPALPEDLEPIDTVDGHYQARTRRTE